MCPYILFVLWFPLLYVINCSFLSMVSLILVHMLLGGSCPLGLCGLALPRKLASGRYLQCQQSKIQSQVKSLVPRTPVPGRRFSHVHLDLVGPLPSCLGFSYLLTMIDRTSQLPEGIPLSSCARAFISKWVLSPSSPDLGQRFPVHVLRLGGRLFHPWDFEGSDY